ncbi:MAG: hypothetical protein WBQ14_09445 [Gaiellaceae bacterium]
MPDDTSQINTDSAQWSVEDLSEHWLWQSFSQLIGSFGGTAEASLKSVVEGTNDERFGLAYFTARLNGARLSMALSAFAAEASINRFLHNRLSGHDLKTAIAIRPPAEKFAVGTRLALGESLFPRDEEIYGKLKTLFTLRNRLVHAKPRQVEAEEVLGASAYEEFNPLVALDHLAIVSKAAQTLLEAHTPPADTYAPKQILAGCQMMRPLAEKVTARPIPTREEVLAEIAEMRASHPQYFLT